jgi:hypothetical protein
VEIYVRGRPLGALLEARNLSMTDDSGSHALAPHEIRLRLNNWDRVRAARFPMLLLYEACCGGGAVLLLLIATGPACVSKRSPRLRPSTRLNHAHTSENLFLD